MDCEFPLGPAERCLVITNLHDPSAWERLVSSAREAGKKKRKPKDGQGKGIAVAVPRKAHPAAFPPMLDQLAESYARENIELRVAATADALGLAADELIRWRMPSVDLVDDFGTTLKRFRFDVNALERYSACVELIRTATDPASAQRAAEAAIGAALPTVPSVLSEQSIRETLQTASSMLDAQAIDARITRRLEGVRRRARQSRAISQEVQRIVASTPEEMLEAVAGRSGVFIIRTGTGWGKTEAATRLLEQAARAGDRPVLVAARRSIVARYASVLPHYEPAAVGQAPHPAGGEANLPGLAICAHSLLVRRFRELLMTARFLVVDEAKQVVDTIATDRNISSREGIFNSLRGLIGNSPTVLLLDADANDELVDFAKASGRRDIHVLDLEADLSHLSASLRTKREAVDQIYLAVYEGRRVRLCIDRKDEAIGLADRIGNDFPGCRTLLIHADNTHLPEQQAFFANPNAAIRDYQLVIHSPAVMSTVSITERHFDLTAAVFCGTIPATDCFQMLRRDRTANAFYIGFAPDYNHRMDNEDQILKTLVPPGREVTANERLIARVKATQAHSSNHVALALEAVMRSQAVRIVPREQQIVPDVVLHDGLGKELRSAARRLYDEGILAVGPIFGEGSEESPRCSQALDGTDYYRDERRTLESTLGKSDIDERDLEMWRQGFLLFQLWNWRILEMSEAQATHLDRRGQYNTFDSRHFTRRRAILKAIADPLDLQLQEPSAIITADVARPVLNDLVSNYFYSILALDLPVALKKEHMNAKSPVPTVRGIASALLGVEWRDLDTTKGGVRQTGKKVDAAHLARLHEVYQSWRSNDDRGTANISNRPSDEAERAPALPEAG
ncbi:hypothetical protein [Sediminicurvatus halobius]|uniref:Replication origin-binding protein domain-containing protein n=1 Tax=Sediminicurvatus halobius TaxID=2182432 RepID=A0A2U2MXY7_9GAMM|nr:hypothetical protein [Spiribacter halobius]PWG61687.1 hypothetical protein DEM34_15110 [Spiribacter halobius]UEX77312.1 hypothetical protein LMH63_15390 [Spiribacter halobius]